MAPTTPDEAEHSQYWEALLAGDDSSLSLLQRTFRKVPSPPRCKLCEAPFSGPYAPLFRLLGFRRWALNQQICRFCVRGMERHRGGAEVDVSLVYVDIRGSTTLAEQMTVREFTDAINRYLAVVCLAVDSENGLIDHMAGDGVMAMWVPGFVGTDHPRHAVLAALRLARDIQTTVDFGDGFPAGVGVHTGRAYVGVVGETGSRDFTVIGDPPNTTARLSAAAGAGDVVMSEEIVAAAGVDTAPLERRLLDLKGKAAPVPAWVWRATDGTPAVS
jgi:class 3 adenylate cyclase